MTAIAIHSSLLAFGVVASKSMGLISPTSANAEDAPLTTTEETNAPITQPAEALPQNPSTGEKPAVADVTRSSKFDGKKIRNITVRVRDIFDDADLGSFYTTANSLKVNTREKVIVRELLFKEGDKYDSFLVKESERNLRSQRFIRNVEIKPTLDGDEVDIEVVVQDTWTLIPQINYSSGTGRNKRSVGLAESNLLGYGKRVEALYEEDDARTSVDLVWDDTRVLDTYHRLVGGYFHRNDGDRVYFHTGRPFRSLVETYSWAFTADVSESVGRLFEASEEEYIFKQDLTDIDLHYTIARGNPEVSLRRYTYGWGFVEEDFAQADDEAYEDLDLDPGEVSNDPERLSEDRRFSGPLFSFERIEPNFVSMSYIDRFDRVEDYNLGDDYKLNLLVAPDFLGSEGDTILTSGSRSRGYRFDRASFIRGEVSGGTRIDDEGLDNTILSAELKYFNVLIPVNLGQFYVGRHTLASSFYIDYAEDLDANREFLLGADNGIRGYKARTFSGDKRFAVNLEDRVHFIDDAFKLVSVGAAFFVEAGAATEDSLGRMFTDEIYSDVGAGLRFAFPRSSGGRVIRLDIALPLRDGPDGSGALEPRIILSGGQLFSARLRSETAGTIQANLATGLDN